MAGRLITVFGGTGFLGRRVVDALLRNGERVLIAVRHPEKRGPAGASGATAIRADIQEPDSVARAVEGAFAAVNCVSLYVESGELTFRSVHVDGAETVARQSTAAGVQRLVHISGIGADAASASDYVRARALGEERVRAAFPQATILRPSVMFGPDDAFLGTLARIISLAPVVPLFGTGETRLQPVHVGDVAEAAVRALDNPAAAGETYELAGPRAYTYRGLLELMASRLGRKRLFLPVPFALWMGLAYGARVLPEPPLTPAQVELMRRDNVPGQAAPGLGELGIDPVSLEGVLAERFPAQGPG